MSGYTAYEGDPTSEPDAFRRCLGQFATGVTVVTANVEGELVGLTANSFASVSLNPPLILWSIDVASSSYSKFSVADGFVINVLADDQIALSRHFGRSGPDKFNGVSCSMGSSGAPILNGVAAFFDCSRESEHRGGDHLILVGRVRRAVRFNRSILLFAQGRYRVAVDHPGEDQIGSSAHLMQVSRG
jgi:flavin reductase (DIM6/NTAB) family NADH-FMN oxidoreductase RutF